jgi:hypothetical protein
MRPPRISLVAALALLAAVAWTEAADAIITGQVRSTTKERERERKKGKKTVDSDVQPFLFLSSLIKNRGYE